MLAREREKRAKLFISFYYICAAAAVLLYKKKKSKSYNFCVIAGQHQ